MKNLDYKWFIIIGLAFIIIIGVFSVIFFSENSRGRYEVKIQALKDTNRVKETRIMFLQQDQKQLQNQIFVRELEINNLNKLLKNLKKKNHEKVDSVATLNNTNTFNYLSNYLSKRGNIR